MRTSYEHVARENRWTFYLTGYTVRMDFDEYEKLAARTGVFEGKLAENPLMYLGLGVTSEAGEVADKIKKIMRNDQGVISEEKRQALKFHNR